MSLNRACIGMEFPPLTMEVSAGATQKYARAYNDDNPAFFDPARPGRIVAPPMFAVVVTWNSIMGAVMAPELQADLLRLVHGEQDMRFLAPIRPGDKIKQTAKIETMKNKRTGETMTGPCRPPGRIAVNRSKRLHPTGSRRRRIGSARRSEDRRTDDHCGRPSMPIRRLREASGDRN